MACDTAFFYGCLFEEGHSWYGEDAELYRPISEVSGIFDDDEIDLGNGLMVKPNNWDVCGNAIGWSVVEPLSGSNAKGCLGVMKCMVKLQQLHQDPIELSCNSPDALDKKVLTFMAQHGILGMQGTWAVGDCDPVSRSWGYSSSDGQELQVDMPMRIASVSKTLTGIACLQLAEQGKLDLDQQVIPILESKFDRNFDLFDERMKQVTIRQLLHHTSGGYSNESNCPMFQSWNASQVELIAEVLGTRGLENNPGEVYSYSNFGYCLLGRVIEQVSDMSYESYLQENVFQPVGASGFSQAPLESAVQYYMSEAVNDSEWNLDPSSIPDFLVDRMDAHGGWRCSASDLAKIAQGLKDGLLLSQSSEELRKTPGKENYAWGCCVNEHAFWHDGALSGTGSILVQTTWNGGCTWALVVNSTSGIGCSELDEFAWTCLEDLNVS